MEASYHSSCYIIQKRKHKEKKTLFFYLCEADVKKNAKPRCELFRLVEGEKGFQGLAVLRTYSNPKDIQRYLEQSKKLEEENIFLDYDKIMTVFNKKIVKVNIKRKQTKQKNCLDTSQNQIYEKIKYLSKEKVYCVEKWVSKDPKDYPMIYISSDKNKFEQILYLEEKDKQFKMKSLEEKQMKKVREKYSLETFEYNNKLLKPMKKQSKQITESMIVYNNGTKKSQKSEIWVCQESKAYLRNQKKQEIHRIIKDCVATLNQVMSRTLPMPKIYFVQKYVHQIIKDVAKLDNYFEQLAKDDILVQIRNQNLSAFSRKTKTLSHWFVYIQYKDTHIRIDLHQGDNYKTDDKGKAILDKHGKPVSDSGIITLDMKKFYQKQFCLENNTLVSVDEYLQMKRDSQVLYSEKAKIKPEIIDAIHDNILDFIKFTNAKGYSYRLMTYNCQSYSKIIMEVGLGKMTLNKAKEWAEKHGK